MAGSALLCMLLLFLTGLIPQSAIADSCRESAVYFKEHELFPYLIDGQFNTMPDGYGDCVVVNIMYHISEEELLPSLIKAYYYNPEMESVEVSLWESLQEEKEPNEGYFRYWHGEMVLLRPLFLFTGIEGARYILGGILLVLTLFTVALLWRQRARALAVCYLLGNLIVQFWVCFFCVGYITTFLMMNIVAVISICLFRHRKDTESLYRNVYILLAASGIYTCFFDFLTTETLTVTIPLLLLLVLRYEAGELENFGKEFKRIVCCGILWVISYAAMFVFKWLLAAGILGWQAFYSAMQSAGEYYNNAVTDTPGIENTIPVAQGGNLIVDGVVTGMTATISKVDGVSLDEISRVQPGRILNVVSVSFPATEATINFYMPGVEAGANIVALQYIDDQWVDVPVVEVRADHVVLGAVKNGKVAFVLK